MDLISDKFIRAFWFSSNNFGDSINSFIVNKLSGKEVCLSQTKGHYIVCGSILSIANEFSTVWGAGFDWEHHNPSNIHEKAKVIAVRGDLSAQKSGRDIAAIGDPALLLPKLYPAYPTMRHEIGIVPHWSNIERCAELYPDDFIVNPLIPFNIFINNLISCDYIFSESLHGLIVADAYGIKNTWVDMKADVGDGFKYQDYYSSTTTPEMKPIEELDIKSCQIHKYKYDLQTLLNSCPFYNGKILTNQ